MTSSGTAPEPSQPAARNSRVVVVSAAASAAGSRGKGASGAGGAAISASTMAKRRNTRRRVTAGPITPLARSRMICAIDTTVKGLGDCRHDSPLTELLYFRRSSHHWVDAGDRVLLDDTAAMVAARGGDVRDLPGFEAGGPRRKIFFDPSKTRVGIVTCGGLCPGLNNVIRGLVMELTRHYGVRRIIGFRNGYQGFIARYGHPVMDLDEATVDDINEDGGTILGSSRGQQDPDEIVDCLEQLGVNILFVIGGDGSLHGAQRIADVIAERRLRIAIVGIPKTIDNDIPYIDHSFGFRTAFSRATESIRAAHIEARSAPGASGW